MVMGSSPKGSLMPIQHRVYEYKRLEKIARLVEGDSVLDIGYAQIPNPYFQVKHRTGLDLEKPKESLYEEELVGDATKLREVLGDRKFDTVVAGEFIEHIETPYEFLRSLKRVLNPGGRVILSSPNPLSWPVIGFELIQSQNFFYTQEHLYYFTPRWMARLIKGSGFQLERMEGVGLFFPGLPFVLPCPVALAYQVIYVVKV